MDFELLITFLTALPAALIVTVLLCRSVIPVLKRHHVGQHIFSDFVAEHKAKEGTPTMGGLFFIAVFMKRVKGYAALTGFIVGEAVVFWMSKNTDANFLLFGAIGMVVSIVVAWMLSLGSYLKSSK